MRFKDFRKIEQFGFVLLALSMILWGCGVIGQPLPGSETALTEVSPTAVTLQSQTPTAQPSATIPVPNVWIDPRLPRQILNATDTLDGVVKVGKKNEALLSLTIDAVHPISSWTYALAAPFATLTDDVTEEAFVAFWQRDAEFPVRILVMPPAMYDSLKARLGNPRADVRPLEEDNLLSFCQTHERAWAILPFEKLEPKWKVIGLDGNSPIHKDFDPESYLLMLSIGWDEGPRSVATAVYELADAALKDIPTSNRDADLLTTVVLTGVTALTRGTAKEMELNGVLSPAVSIGELMREADVAHVSNEVTFARDCPAPRWVQEVDLVFCSDVRYIDLLREIGTDVVELTGDHLSDWGPEAMRDTIKMYNEEGWFYYGGGENLADAREPLKITHNGNKIAFVGCNAKAPGYATASETQPGALHCDMDDLSERIQALVAEGYQVIVTFQHQEIYRWNPTEQMIEDSHLAADAGAAIVSGSQAHQPHAMEFYGDSFIHYGLGNLFFDQLYWFEDSNKAFLDRHIFYGGRYLGVELLTVQFFNWSTPTLMTPEARAAMLERLFAESGLTE